MGVKKRIVEKEAPVKYEPAVLEPSVRKMWEKEKIFSPDLDSPARKPYTKSSSAYYNLMMFPYPSAEGLHVGNMYAFTGSDIWGRYQRMQGRDVFEPIGLDGFGIHSENYAIKIGEHPKRVAERTEKHFYEQLHATGNSFDWTRTLETYDPGYYKWTQWLFTEMFKHGLAYREKATVNWCPSCKTVLADEQVINDHCERCNTKIELKKLEQWFLKITDYADRLLVGLDKIDWPEKIKIVQRNWIGRSEGALIRFELAGPVGSSSRPMSSGEPVGTRRDSLRSRHPQDYIEVFTTRPDTLFGATFMVVSPELAQEWLSNGWKAGDEVKMYVEKALANRNKEETEKEKTGVFSGIYAINPVNQEKIPVWIADYVLAGYGTGAIMAVPAHDQRDFDFAVKFGLPVKQVVLKKDAPIKSYVMGIGNISDKDLEDLGIEIVEKTQEGSLKIEIPEKSIKAYEDLIREKMELGFWNEYVGKETVFIFKHKDGKVERLILGDETEQHIDKLAAEFINDETWNKTSVWKWLAENDWYRDVIVHTESGDLINSGKFSGMESDEAKWKITEAAEGTRKVQYHLRDWLISRQRYWGPPIPMIYCEACARDGRSWFTENGNEARNGKRQTSDETSILTDKRSTMRGWHPVPEAQLPVELPYIKNYQPRGLGESPLAQDKEWMKVKCPGCGRTASRETDVSDTFLDSSWYFLRYLATDSDKAPFPSGKWKLENGKSLAKRESWLPVSMYIGGAEHSVLHLMYVRFITMALHDWGYLPFEEPFPRFYAHGLLISEGAKMSKSKGNVIVPDEYIKKYGADTLRMYLMFLGPFDQGGDFRDTGIEGMFKFIRRVWDFVLETRDLVLVEESDSREVLQKIHQTIKRVTEDMDGLRYNRAIAGVMEFVNFLQEVRGRKVRHSTGMKCAEWEQALQTLVLLLAPFAPHMTEELWQSLALIGNEARIVKSKTLDVTAKPNEHRNRDLSAFSSVHLQPWPKFDPELAQEEIIEIPVQVNGKLRGTIKVGRDEANKQDVVERQAREVIEKYLIGVKKVVFVPGRLINFVV